MKFFLLVLLILCFLGTRLYQIDVIPPSLYWDEASIAYNAYSITQDGKDEWGSFLPIHFRAFGEFKLPVYIYSTSIFIKLFGLNELSVRLPAVIYSVISIFLVFLIGKKIMGNFIGGWISAFIFSISPWFFIFSRAGYEATAGVMFFCLGFYLFLLRKQKYWLIFISLTSFIMSAYSYNSFRILLPFVFSYIFIDSVKSIKDRWKLFLFIGITIIIFVISVYPIFKLVFYDAGYSRLTAVGIFSADRSAIEITGELIGNYLSHLNPSFLFMSGDSNLRSQQYGFGQLYIIDSVFLVSSFWFIIKNKANVFIPVILVVLIGLLPASITKESPHALRSIIFAPFISLIIGYGILNVRKIIKSKYYSISALFIYLIFFSYYVFNFYYAYPIYSSRDWQYGYKKIFREYSSNFNNYERVYISDEEGQPYIFALYYLRYNPEKFRNEVEYNPPGKWGSSLVKGFNNFVFYTGGLPTINEKKVLIFAKPAGFNNRVKVDEVRNLDGQVAFNVYE